MVDIADDLGNTKLFYYAVAAMKEVLSRPQLDDIQIYFFTFDQIIQEYSFDGLEVMCTIYDQTINTEGLINVEGVRSPCFLKDIRV